MGIETGDGLPISKTPYNLSLKHTALVQKDLETMEKAGIFYKVFPLWASPIVVV